MRFEESRVYPYRAAEESADRLHRRNIKRLVGDGSLQAGVLILKRPQLAGARHVYPGQLAPPQVKRRRTDPVPPAQLVRLRPILMLLQDHKDLLIRKPRSLHGSFSSSKPEAENSSNQWPDSKGDGQGLSVLLELRAGRV